MSYKIGNHCFGCWSFWHLRSVHRQVMIRSYRCVCHSNVQKDVAESMFFNDDITISIHFNIVIVSNCVFYIVKIMWCVYRFLPMLSHFRVASHVPFPFSHQVGAMLPHCSQSPEDYVKFLINRKYSDVSIIFAAGCFLFLIHIWCYTIKVWLADVGCLLQEACSGLDLHAKLWSNMSVMWSECSHLWLTTSLVGDPKCCPASRGAACVSPGSRRSKCTQVRETRGPQEVT